MSNIVCFQSDKKLGKTLVEFFILYFCFLIIPCHLSQTTLKGLKKALSVVLCF